MTGIQPCALLLLVGPEWRVETASANVAMLGRGEAEEVVGKPLSDLIGDEATHALRNRMAWLSDGPGAAHEFGANWHGVGLDVSILRGEDHYLIEAETIVEPRLPDSIGMVRSMMERLTSGDPVGSAEQAMRQLCALTGFDRMEMLDRGGAVIAAGERRKLPSADVPEPDEEIRVLADASAAPVKLVGKLEHRVLRRAIHQIPAAQILGSGSALSFPLRIDGEHVGWLRGRHCDARRVSAERRAIVHLFAERVAARMMRLGWKP